MWVSVLGGGCGWVCLVVCVWLVVGEVCGWWLVVVWLGWCGWW